MSNNGITFEWRGPVLTIAGQKYTSPCYLANEIANGLQDVETDPRWYEHLPAQLALVALLCRAADEAHYQGFCDGVNEERGREGALGPYPIAGTAAL